MSFSQPVLQSRHVDMPAFQNRQVAYKRAIQKSKKGEEISLITSCSSKFFLIADSSEKSD